MLFHFTYKRRRFRKLGSVVLLHNSIAILIFNPNRSEAVICYICKIILNNSCAAHICKGQFLSDTTVRKQSTIALHVTTNYTPWNFFVRNECDIVYRDIASCSEWARRRDLSTQWEGVKLCCPPYWLPSNKRFGLRYTLLSVGYFMAFRWKCY